MQRFLAVLLFGGILTAHAQPAESWLDELQEAVIHYGISEDLTDPVARLQRRISKGETPLRYDKDTGYLKALLKALQVPVSAQGLVFSKSSSQADWTSPRTPRALFFNDEVYIGWAPNAPQLDLIAIDAKKGPIFYTLDQRREATTFARPRDCQVCHQTGKTRFFPGLVASSFETGMDGVPKSREVSFALSHETPVSLRWGGWYVTGTLHDSAGKKRTMELPTENATHMGNIFAGVPDEVNRARLGSLKDVKSMIDGRRYLSKASDVVALLVFEHQARMHNLLTQANYETRLALAAEGRSSGEKSELPENARFQIKQSGERLLEYMLFRREAPLNGPVRGTTRFATEFQRTGAVWASGRRSLRELQLQTRLFRYPCSYLVYSPAFDALPLEMKNYLWPRLEQILTGRDRNEPYADMAGADRQAVLEILRETKPEFAAWLKRSSTATKAEH